MKNFCNDIEEFLIENCSFYNNVDLYVEHLEDETYIIHYESLTLDRIDFDEIDTHFRIQTLEFSETGIDIQIECLWKIPY